MTDALDDVSVDLESAQGDEATAVDDVMTLSNAAAAADLKAAAAVALDDLATIDQDISDAQDDLALARAAYTDLSSADRRPRRPRGRRPQRRLASTGHPCHDEACPSPPSGSPPSC